MKGRALRNTALLAEFPPRQSPTPDRHHPLPHPLRRARSNGRRSPRRRRGPSTTSTKLGMCRRTYAMHHPTCSAAEHSRDERARWVLCTSTLALFSYPEHIAARLITRPETGYAT